MSTWIEEYGLHMEGFSDEDIAAIDAAKDDFMHIWATFMAVKPRIDRVAPVVKLILERLDANQKAGQI